MAREHAVDYFLVYLQKSFACEAHLSRLFASVFVEVCCTRSTLVSPEPKPACANHCRLGRWWTRGAYSSMRGRLA